MPWTAHGHTHARILRLRSAAQTSNAACAMPETGTCYHAGRRAPQFSDELGELRAAMQLADVMLSLCHCCAVTDAVSERSGGRLPNLTPNTMATKRVAIECTVGTLKRSTLM